MKQDKEAKEGKFEEIPAKEAAAEQTTPSAKTYGYSVKLSGTETAGAAQETQLGLQQVATEDTNIKQEARAEQPSVETKPAEQQVTPEQMQKLQNALKSLKENNMPIPDALKGIPPKPQDGAPVKHARKSPGAAMVAVGAGIASVSKGCLVAIDAFANFIVRRDYGTEDVIQKARAPILFGMWICVITFLIAGVWSGLAPLDSASNAMGFVVPSSKKQRVQNKEGGIVEEIYVKEGQEVAAAQPLVRFSEKSYKPQLDSLKAQKASLENQLELVRERVSAVEKLVHENYVQKRELLQMQLQEAQTLNQLTETESRINNLEEVMLRLIVTAPTSGTVNQVQVHTLGEVVHPGETLMIISPKDDTLVIEAYVAPDKIDDVRVGLKARVMITAFKHRSVSPLEGTVTHVSSDVVEPPLQGKIYGSPEGQILAQQGGMFRVRIEINPAELKTISKYRNYELQPGMQASVNIVTGERTLLQYMLDPITTTFWHAFKEK